MNYTLTEKSVTVLTDDFPDFDTAAAEKLCGFLRDSGYIIKQISAAVFKKIFMI